MKRGELEAWGGVTIPTQAKCQSKLWQGNPSPILSRLQRLFSVVNGLPFGYLLLAAVVVGLGVEVVL